MASTLLGRKQSRLRRNTFREREEVVVVEEHAKRQNKRQNKKQTGMKETEGTIQWE